MPKYGINVVTPAVTLPVSVPEAIEHMSGQGVDLSTPYVTDLINDAVDYLERETYHTLCPTTYELTMDQFPYYVANRVLPYDYRRSAFMLPRNPVQSITSVIYTDIDGNSITMVNTDYGLSNAQWPARMLPVAGKVWPFANPFGVDSVKIRFVAGYNAGLVPYVARRAVKMLVSHFHQNREPLLIGKTAQELPHTLKSCINKLKYRGFIA